MARKVFISILGTGFYSKCKYVADNFITEESRFIQIATLEWIGAKNWTKDDTALFLLTEKAKSDNWKKSIIERINPKSDKKESYWSLEKCLEEEKLPFTPQGIDIVDGKDEKEMWQIFETIYAQLKENDELYIDLTHSFRYLPMLLLVLSNYAKFLKNITIAHISYGNYEARENNIAPFVDLLPIVALQNWTIAASDYLKNGNIKPLQELVSQNLQPIPIEANGSDLNASKLKDFVNAIATCVEDFQTCRGMNIVKSINLKNAKPENVASIIKPLSPIIDKVKSEFSCFSTTENVINGFHASKWCYDNGLYQQSATILQESVVTFFCIRHNIKIDDENRRECINKAFNIKANNNESNKDKWIAEETFFPIIESILRDDLFNSKEIIAAFTNLTEVRNDFNHSGMRSKRPPMKPKNLKANIEKCINIFIKLTDKC